MRIRWWAAPGALAAVALLAACGSSGSGSGSSSAAAPASSAAAAATPLPSPVSTSAVGIKTMTAGGHTYLVTAQGAAIYLFAPDTSTHSACTPTCLKFWPALIGPGSAAPGSGLTGKFGTITGTGGIKQTTYDGHPLYLFAADKNVGQVSGNGLNTAGGLWWGITPTGTDLPKAPAASTGGGTSGGGSTSGGGGGGGAGGYGY